MKKTQFNIYTLLVLVGIILILTSCQNEKRLVVGKIKKASKLATAEFTVDKIVYGVKRKKFVWVVNLNEATFIAHSKAIIKAGINLERIKDGDVIIEGNKISLTLPHVEVINFSYPAEHFRKDSLISGDAFMNKITLYDQEQFFQEAEIDIRNNLKYMDIVKTTEKKTILMLENLLKNLGYNEIYIDFHEGELIPEIEIETEG